MSFEPEFLDMMPHTLTRYVKTGQSISNVPVYDEDNPEQFRCRISGKALELRRRESADDTVIFDIYVCPFPVVEGKVRFDLPKPVFKTSDKLVLPPDQGFQDETPIIFAVGNITDEDGLHHWKLQCGWMYHRQGQ